MTLLNLRNVGVALIVILMAGSSYAFADEAAASADASTPQKESYVSALVGAAVSTSAGGGNIFIWSGRIGTTLIAKPQGLLSLGLAIAGDSSGSNVGTVTISTSSTLILAELISRHLFETGLYFGARFGIGLENATVTAGSLGSFNASATTFPVGPAAGYEFAVAPAFAIDLDISWLASSGVTLVFPGLASIPLPASSAFTFQAGAIYHW